MKKKLVLTAICGAASLLIGCGTQTKPQPEIKQKIVQETTSEKDFVELTTEYKPEEIPSGEVHFSGDIDAFKNVDEVAKALMNLYTFKLQTGDEFVTKLEEFKKFTLTYNVDNIRELYMKYDNTNDRRTITGAAKAFRYEVSNNDDSKIISLYVKYAQSPINNDSIETIGERLFEVLENGEASVKERKIDFEITKDNLLKIVTPDWLSQ
jgi:lipoprotein